MEQATLRQPLATRSSFPPGPRMPGLVSGARYARDPIGFFVRLQRRYGNVFSVRFPYFGRVVSSPTRRSSSRSSPATPPSFTPARRTRRCSSRRWARTRS